jgi:hypothetical protein
MKRDVMLPKFNLPGQSTWLMKGLWIAGGVVLIQVVVVATLFLRQGVGKSETMASPPPPVATESAAAPPKTPPPPPTSPEPEPAQPAAAQNLPPPATRPPAPASESPTPAAGNRGPGKPGLARFRGKGARRNGDRVFARSGVGPRKAAAARGIRRNGPRGEARNPGMRAGAPRPQRKPDAVDQLLRNFK